MALAFDDPRNSVIMTAATSPPIRRAAHNGTWRGGFAPSALREHRQPFGDRCGIVVDDVVDTAGTVLDGLDGGARGIADLHERPHPVALPGERQSSLADQLDLHAVGVSTHRRSRAVEIPVAQRDSVGPVGADDHSLEVRDRLGGRAHLRRRRRVERIVLGLDHAPGAGVRPRRETLRHEPLDAHRAAGSEQIVGARGSQPIRGRERALHSPKVERPDRGELVHDHVGVRVGDDAPDGAAVERIRHDRPRPETANQILLAHAARHAGDLMPAGDEFGHQRTTDDAGCPCHEDLHFQLLSVRCLRETRLGAFS